MKTLNCTHSLFSQSLIIFSLIFTSSYIKAQNLKIISLDSNDMQVVFNAAHPFISGNGQFVVFESADLLPTNGVGRQIYLRDLNTNALELISVNTLGVGGNSASRLPVTSNSLAISDDGRYVVFNSSATDIVAGQNPSGFNMIYLRDRQLQTTSLVSKNSAGSPSNSLNTYYTMAPQATGAGGVVIGFNSFANNLDPLDTDGNNDTFIHETVLGTTKLACFNLMGDKISGGCQDFSLSCAGGAIAFRTNQSGLVVGDDSSSVNDIYVGLPFVGDSHQLMTVDTNGNPSDVDTFTPPSLTCDARRVAFSTTYSIQSNDPVGTADTYVRDTVSGEIFRLMYELNTPVGLSTPSFSSNGHWLALETFTSLDPIDIGNPDIYLLNFINQQMPGEITLISQNNGSSSNIGALFGYTSNQGDVVFSSGSTNLSQITDSNNSIDIFAYASDIIFQNGFD